VVAPGSTVKSALRYAQAIALAIGKPITGDHIFVRSLVLLISFEDDVDEIRRRVEAVCQYYHVSREELAGWLFYAAPKNLNLAEMSRRGSRELGALEKLLRQYIVKLKIDLLMLDPFVKLHALEENDNGAMDFVCDVLAKLAIEYDIAIDAPHHAKKGIIAPGDADAGRGRSSIRDAGRLVYTLTPMIEKEAEAYGIPTTERRLHIRLDNAKVNLIPGSLPVAWYNLVGVSLGNGNQTYPSGDVIQTITRWTPRDKCDGPSHVQLNAMLDDIEKGLPERAKLLRLAGSDDACGLACREGSLFR
jgi:hypothetical protein